MEGTTLTLPISDAAARIPDRYISVAIDASQIIGGYWWDDSDRVSGGLGNRRTDPLDLKDTRLLELTRKLNPPYIRIGGTEADRLYYSVKKKQEPAALPEGYHYVLGKERWKDLENFCRFCGARMMITLNAGPGPRTEKSRWRRKNARHLIEYNDARNHSVRIWELGNEVNAYSFFMGLSHRVSPSEYARDMKRLKNC